MTNAGVQLAYDSQIGNIAAEIATRQATAETFTEAHPDEDRLWGEVCDLLDELAALRPQTVQEALIVAAVAAAQLHDIDEVGAILHRRAVALNANLVDYLQQAAGVTAGELGVGNFAECRHKGPAFSHDGAETLRIGYECGYLAAVRRFTPTSYRYVKAELAGGITQN